MARKTLLTTPRFSVEEVPYEVRGKPGSKAIVRHPGAVAILPLVSANELCLIENSRVSVGKRLLEIPAGTLEPDEEPLVTARRELLEETGYQAERWELLCSFYVSPGILDERMYLFVAADLRPGPASLEPDESITTRIVSWRDALELVRTNQIEDAKSICGILFFAQFRGDQA